MDSPIYEEVDGANFIFIDIWIRKLWLFIQAPVGFFHIVTVQIDLSAITTLQDCSLESFTFPELKFLVDYSFGYLDK